MSKKAHIKMEAAIHAMKLRQMGGKVTQVDSKLCYVSFEIEHITVEYVYNINHHNKFFIERIKPYPEPLDTFTSEDELIQQIEWDLEQFKNASHSKNIDEFIEINQKLNQTIGLFEDLYLYYNVPKSQADIILNKINEIDVLIYQISDTAEKIYFDKKPRRLKCPTDKCSTDK